MNHRHWKMILLLLYFTGGCSNDAQTESNSTDSKPEQRTVDIALLVGRPRAELLNEFEKPSDSSDGFDDFSTPDIFVQYDAKDSVKQVTAGRAAQSNVEVIGARIGDNIETLVRKWGDPLSRDEPSKGVSRIRWIHRGFRIDVWVNQSPETENEAGVPRIPTTVSSFSVRRPDHATNLPFPDGAKEVLTKTLDCWVLGDSLSDFKAKHDDIDVVELGVSNWSDGNVLQRYEIGPFRTLRKEDIEVKKIVDFAVTLVFQSKAGTEIKNAVRINVSDMTDYFETRGYKVYLKPK